MHPMGSVQSSVSCTIPENSIVSEKQCVLIRNWAMMESQSEKDNDSQLCLKVTSADSQKFGFQKWANHQLKATFRDNPAAASPQVRERGDYSNGGCSPDNASDGSIHGVHVKASGDTHKGDLVRGRAR